MMVNIRLAKKEDILIIKNLSTIIWNNYYVPIIGQEQVNYMLDKMYNYETLLQQFYNEKHSFYLIMLHEKVVGFLSVSSENKTDFFIHKFYIHPENTYSGIVTQALNFLVKILHPKTIELHVNRQNFKSINFYFKNGFYITDVRNIAIGAGYEMNDFTMKKNY